MPKGIILCHYGTRYSQCGSYRCQYCRCKIPQKLYQPRFVLLSHISTDLIPNFILAWIITVFFFCPQIITDLHILFFGTEIRDFILNKDTAGSALIFPRHFVITACFASSQLSLLCGNEPCLYLSIALKLMKPFPSCSQPCLFQSRVNPCLKNHHPVPLLIINQ